MSAPEKYALRVRLDLLERLMEHRVATRTLEMHIGARRQVVRLSYSKTCAVDYFCGGYFLSNGKLSMLQPFSKSKIIISMLFLRIIASFPESSAERHFFVEKI